MTAKRPPKKAPAKRRGTNVPDRRQKELQARWDRLSDEAWREFEDTDTALWECMFEALEGDPSQAKAMAARCFEATLSGGVLSAIERLWLVEALSRVVTETSVANAIAMKTGRGAPRKGLQKLEVASDVLSVILKHEVTRLEDAWDKVAQRRHLSFDTVKAYWAERRVAVCCSRKDELGMGPDEDIDAAIKSHLARAKG